jgi:hypothetical protein
MDFFNSLIGVPNSARIIFAPTFIVDKFTMLYKGAYSFIMFIESRLEGGGGEIENGAY